MPHREKNRPGSGERLLLEVVKRSEWATLFDGRQQKKYSRKTFIF